MALFLLFFLPWAFQGQEEEESPSLLRESFESSYRLEKDYTSFGGRVTDTDHQKHILKIKADTRNVRFFKVGDVLTFKRADLKDKKEFCRGYVKDREEGNFVAVFVEDISPCQGSADYFRRGTILAIAAPVMEFRIRDAALFRTQLLERREASYNQLNEINHFLWTYDQQKVTVSAEFDRSIQELQKEKEEAVSSLVSKKSNSLKIQKKLSRNLEIMDRELEFYTVDNEGHGELLDDGEKIPLFSGDKEEGHLDEDGITHRVKWRF